MIIWNSLICRLIINIQIAVFDLEGITKWKKWISNLSKFWNWGFSDVLLMLIFVRSVGPVSVGPSGLFEIRLNFFCLDLIRLKFSLSFYITTHHKLSCSNVKLLGKFGDLGFEVFHLIEISVQNSWVHFGFFQKALLFHGVFDFLYFLYVGKSQEVKNCRGIGETLFGIILDSFLVFSWCPGKTLLALVKVLCQLIDEIFGLIVNRLVKLLNLLCLGIHRFEHLHSID